MFKNLTLSKETVTPNLLHSIVNLQNDSPEIKNYHHKVLIQGWISPDAALNSIEEYYSVKSNIYFFDSKKTLSSFYTDNFQLIRKIIYSDFKYENHKSVQVILCQKSSKDLWNVNEPFEEVFISLLNKRTNRGFNDETNLPFMALDLSNFNNDKGVLNMGFNLNTMCNESLTHYMSTLYKECTSLNLASNKLGKLPDWFKFMNLSSLNLSYNNFTSLIELNFNHAMLLQNLWLEGNPLCEPETSLSYVKKVKTKFPKIISLDGIDLQGDENTLFNYMRNYISSPHAQTIVDRFLLLYFTCFDVEDRNRLSFFYQADATIVFQLEYKARHGIPMKNDSFKNLKLNAGNLTVSGKDVIAHQFKKFPEIAHDPSTFTVDVPFFKKTSFQLIIEGVFRDLDSDMDSNDFKNIYSFRKSIIFTNKGEGYLIQNEIMHILPAPLSFLATAFQKPVRKYSDFTLLEPSEDSIDTAIAVFSYLTKLKKRHAEQRLKVHNWDLKKALMIFLDELTQDRIPTKAFISNTKDYDELASSDDNQRDFDMVD